MSTTVQRRLIAVALAAVVAIALFVFLNGGDDTKNSNTYTFDGAQQAPAVITVADRKAAEQFSGDLLSGTGTYRLAQDAGKVTVVNFWGAWCDPCKVETPQFDQIYRAYKSKGVTFVGIDIKEADRGLPRAFVERNKISYPIVYDNEGEVAIRLGNIRTQGAPFTAVLDKQHRVAGVYFNRMAPADLEPILNKLLAEK